MCATELGADRAELALLKLADRDAAPAIRRPDYGGVHQLEHGPLAEGVGNDLGAAAFFEEKPLEQVRCPDHLAVTERKAEMRDAGVEVLEETRQERRPLALIGLDKIVAQ